MLNPGILSNWVEYSISSNFKNTVLFLKKKNKQACQFESNFYL